MKTEEAKRRFRLGMGCMLLMTILLLSAKEDHFQKLINHQQDPRIAMELEYFRQSGIERAVSLEEYDPEKVIAEAQRYTGTPAHMGGTSFKGIDCSGLVMMAHRSCGICLPHSAEEQARYGAVVPFQENLQRGDLIFFYDSYSSSKFITHSGIYLGEGKFIHTSSSKGVMVSELQEKYWQKRFLFGTRFAD